MPKWVSGLCVMRRAGSHWSRWDPRAPRRLITSASLADAVSWFEAGATWYGDDLMHDNRGWLARNRGRMLARALAVLADALAAGHEVERAVVKVRGSETVACLVAAYTRRAPLVLAIGSPDQFEGVFDTPYIT